MIRRPVLPGIVVMVALAGCVQAQHNDGPQPRAITPGAPGKAPSDAVVLFDGTDLSHWTVQNGAPAKCKVADGAMACKTGSGDLFSKEKFRGAQIHPAYHALDGGGSFRKLQEPAGLLQSLPGLDRDRAAQSAGRGQCDVQLAERRAGRPD